MIQNKIMTGRDMPAVKAAPHNGDLKAFTQFVINLQYVGEAANWQIGEGAPVRAWVNRSLWCADCPDCTNNMPVALGVPFFCSNCLNAKNGGLAREVIFPDNRGEIERVLSMRADPNTRNWFLTETVGVLIQQNKDHGEWTED